MDDIPLKISWSRLKTWEHCKQKAWLHGKGVKGPSTDVRVFFRGIVTDRILRDWLQNSERLPGTMASQVEEYVELCQQEHKDNGSGIVRWKHSNDKSQTIEWCKTLLENTEPLLEELVLPYFPHVHADKHLKTLIRIPGLDGSPREVELIGILDILIDHPDFMAIWDLKATDNENYYKQTIMQLVFYYLMVKGTYKRIPDKTALLQPMCKEKVKYLEITEEHVLNLMQKIVNYAHSVWRQEFTPKVSDSGCLNFCDVSHACVKFKKNSEGRVSWI